ncbi:MAG TPA: hypothetical protein VEK39_10710 [Solirubrobacterales bacterium]|nr:hypothetical protein [Solirubrobacterales bacterium]
MTATDWRRLALLVLGVPQLGVGLWAVIVPRRWYDTFPGTGSHWLPAFGPYNEHFAVDAGAGILAAGAIAVIAAIWLERRVVQVAMIGFLAWSVPHAVWHLTALDALDTADNVVNVTLLAVTVALPVVLLLSADGLPDADRSSRPDSR